MYLINIDVIRTNTQYAISRRCFVNAQKHPTSCTFVSTTLQYEYCSYINEFSSTKDIIASQILRSTNQFPLVRVEGNLLCNVVIVYVHSVGNPIVLVVAIDTTTAATLSLVDVAVVDHGAGSETKFGNTATLPCVVSRI